VRSIWGLKVALLLAPATSVYAQSAPDTVAREAQRVQDRENQKQTEREEQFRSLQETPPSGQEATAPEAQISDDGQCVPVREISLKGLTLYSENSLSE
jgi:hemolysin activation/secretion protein